MVIKEKCFIVGSLRDNREIWRIRNILDDMQCIVFQALKDGNPVNRENAYLADSHSGPTSISSKYDVVLVECEVKGIRPHKVIDYSRPLDPGYEGSLDHFWEESSLGQIYALLELGEPPKADLLLAAWSYSLIDALQGRCPGVLAREVLEDRCNEIGQLTNYSLDMVLNEVNTRLARLSEMEIVDLGEQVAVIVPGISNDSALSYPSAKLAAAIEGKPVIAHLQDEVHGRHRLHLSGAKPPVVDRFMEKWAPEEGLYDIYGKPEFGYAGGYIKIL